MKAESQLVTTVIMVLALMSSSATAQSRREIDVRKSILTVRVYKSGMFSAFAHDHEIRAPIQSGAFDEQKRSVEFKVNSRELKVLDPDGSDDKPKKPLPFMICECGEPSGGISQETSDGLNLNGTPARRPTSGFGTAWPRSPPPAR